MVHFGSGHAGHEESVHAEGMGIIVNGETIETIKSSEELVAEWGLGEGTSNGRRGDHDVFDLRGQAIVPGLIDGHTHLLWAGDRSQEVAWR